MKAQQTLTINRQTLVHIQPSKLKPYERNPRKNDAAVDRMVASIKEYGFKIPILATADGVIVAGHTRLKAAKKLGLQTVPVIYCDGWTEAQVKAFRLLENASAGWSEWDNALLRQEVLELRDMGFDLNLTGFDVPDIQKMLFDAQTPLDSTGSLIDRFVVPPFSVLDARSGYWQSRKAMWLALGIQSEIGRKAKTFHTEGNIAGDQTGTSVFDPVLCELCYRWFCPPNGKILDPYAGGSVRGIVGARLARSYTGIDLRKEQVEANRAQWKMIGGEGNAQWIAGDAEEEVKKLGRKWECDFIFTCPPYFDLEKYSDDPRDLSGMMAKDFVDCLTGAIVACCRTLRNNRFAAIVVGDVRDEKGIFRDLPGIVKLAFNVAGLNHYNQAVIVQPLGSLPVRVAAQFTGSRKLGNTHQQLLIFVKGDPKQAAKDIGEVQCGNPSDFA